MFLAGKRALVTGSTSGIGLAIARALAKPSVRQRLQKIDFEPAPGSPEALSRLVKTGTDFWEPVVKGSGWVLQ